MTREREERPRRYEEAPPRYSQRPDSQRPPAQRLRRERMPTDGRYQERPVRRPYREEDAYDERRRPRSDWEEDVYGEPPRRPRPPREGQRPTNRRMPPPRNPEYGGNRHYDERSYGNGRPRPQGMRPPTAGPVVAEDQKTSGKKRIFLFLYNLIFYSFTIGILMTALMFAFSEQTDASILGYRFYQVLTDSMAPVEGAPDGGFYSGDVVIVKMMDGSEVQPGDIVTYQLGGGKSYLTHRMVERLTELNGEPGDYIVTKGDANNSNDPPIKAERVHGKVIFVVPNVGTLLTFVRNSFWLCLVCALSLFGFFLVLKAYFLEPNEAKKQAKKGV
ncbi:signal peptidase I [Enterococcus sp. 669A]|uniref:Signal peptidase I n=1 Tax=Candidatus Enterococcus moelleringii TaxID=2815325 RepID=A0ABS3L9G7_9ENTE|nr:signal peptidase I [Enterococcus sp. 669A]MBO1305745.1 signal peptidase I [Enterococcus sp. 669A]